MKAYIQEKYGTSANIKLQEVDKPLPQQNEVLIKIYATTINDYDWSIMRGKPYLYRLMFGIIKPKMPTSGMELAGIVEAVGENVSKLKIGDKVYGDISGYGFGTFAEYISINENAVVHKPDSMSFEEAASLPHAALLASQSLLDIGKIQKGQKILINGAGGGFGTFAYQIAKQYTDDITGVDTGEKLETMKDLGFKHIIDYTKQDFTKNGEKYDLVVDAKTNRAAYKYIRALVKGGKYVTVGGHVQSYILLLFHNLLFSKFSSKSLNILGLKPNKGLDYINKLHEEGILKPVIDGPHEFEKIPELIDYFGKGLHTGKIVIRVAE